MPGTIVAGSGAPSADGEKYAACLRRELTEDDLRAAATSSLTGDWDAPAVSTLADAQGRCSRASLPPDPE